jgi:hypothetical protein
MCLCSSFHSFPSFLITCCVIQFLSLVGTVVFSVCISSTSHIVTTMGACLDAITIGVFVWVSPERSEGEIQEAMQVTETPGTVRVLTFGDLFLVLLV